jgi:UDP-glucose 4-epimerase
MAEVIIIGGNGFIGEHLSRALRKDTVFSMDYPKPDLLNLEMTRLFLTPLLTPKSIVIFLSCIKKESGDSEETYQKNIMMMASFCQVLKNHPVKKLIYFSSAAVYGEDKQNLNITENSRLRPSSHYGYAKMNSEKRLKSIMKKGLVILRPPVIYGLGERTISYSPSGFLKKALAKEHILRWGDGKEKRGFIYIDDVVKIVKKLIHNDFEGVLNLANEESYTFDKAIDLISYHLPVKVVTKPRTKPLVHHNFNNTKFKKTFPKFRFTTLKEGITKMMKPASL